MAETLLKTMIEERGWTYDGFHDEYRRSAEELYRETLDRKFKDVALAPMTFWRWLNGTTGKPRKPAPRILERMFNTPIEELMGPPSGRRTKRAIEQVINESELRMTAHEAAAHAGDAASHVLPDLTLDQIEDDLVDLVRAHATTPPYTVYMRGKQILQLATVMLDRTQVLSQRRRLYVVAGQSSSLLAACSTDLGSMSTAVELLRASALYGQVAEHGPLQAYAHGYLAILAYMNGTPAQALRLVKIAQQFTGVGDTGKARLFAIEARALGHLGRTADAKRAIHASLEPGTGARDDIHDETGGEFDFPMERIAMSNSTTFLLLREGAEAEAAASQSLDLIAHGRPGSTPLPIGAKAGADLAMARLLRDDLDGASDALHRVFDLPREWRSPGLRERVNAVRKELALGAFREAPDARQLAEQIEDFVQLSGPNGLGPGS